LAISQANDRAVVDVDRVDHLAVGCLPDDYKPSTMQVDADKPLGSSSLTHPWLD
jgi:hypothetical protein